MTKEKPILFSAPMVKAILEGRKTQTRRVMKPQPEQVNACASPMLNHKGNRLPFPSGSQTRRAERRNQWVFEAWQKHCPYGHLGERLWVRETWASADYLYKDSDNDPPEFVAFKADGFIYGPDNTLMTKNLFDGTYKQPEKWRPSIFMPRWASRITLEITGVRVQRLQEISEEDAKAEGLTQWTAESGTIHYGESVADVWETSAAKAYARLWDTINGKRGFSWESNPFVWVIEFRNV